MKNVTLIVKLEGFEPLVYQFNTASEAKVADRYIQRQWSEEYKDSKIIYGEQGE